MCEIKGDISLISLTSIFVKLNSIAVLIKELTITVEINNSRIYLICLPDSCSDVPIIMGSARNGSLILKS